MVLNKPNGSNHKHNGHRTPKSIIFFYFILRVDFLRSLHQGSAHLRQGGESAPPQETPTTYPSARSMFFCASFPSNTPLESPCTRPGPQSALGCQTSPFFGSQEKSQEKEKEKLMIPPTTFSMAYAHYYFNSGIQNYKLFFKSTSFHILINCLSYVVQ